MSILKQLLSVAFVVLLWPLTAGAIPYSNLYVFGDSLSDTGNMYAASGHSLPPAPYYDGGRSSNGALWVEQFAPAIGLSYNLANNYAWVGAGTGYSNAWDPTSAHVFPGLADEVNTFAAGLGGGLADPNALYVVWAGPNDFLSITDPNQVAAAITNGVTNMATAVATLSAVGAQHFLVPNMPDLGLTPRANVAGMSAQMGGITAAYNLGLEIALSSLGLDITIPDTAALMQAIVADPTAYGLTNATDWCFNEMELYMGGTPTVCSNPQEYLFWDSVHPTTAGHGLMANLFASAINVPEPGTLVLLLVGMLTMLGLRIRHASMRVASQIGDGGIIS